MAKAGTVRQRGSQSRPYDRSHQEPAKEETGRSIFSRLRSFLWGSHNENTGSGASETTFDDSVARVPAIIDEEPSTLADNQADAMDYSLANDGSSLHSPQRTGHNLQPPVMSTPFKQSNLGTSTPLDQSFANRSMAPLNTASPNEALLEFFRNKGDEELSNMEVVGVLSLIGQAVSRNESLVDFSTIHQRDSPNATYDMPSSILGGASTVTPNVSGIAAVQTPSRHSSPAGATRSWSSRRRGLASGPKISRSRPSSPYSAPARPSAPSSLQASPRPMSNTASTLLEILDEPASDKPGSPRSFSPQKRKDTSGFNVSSIEDSYTKYRPTRSSGLRNTVHLDSLQDSEPANGTGGAVPLPGLSQPKADPKPLPAVKSPELKSALSAPVVEKKLAAAAVATPQVQAPAAAPAPVLAPASIPAFSIKQSNPVPAAPFKLSAPIQQDSKKGELAGETEELKERAQVPAPAPPSIEPRLPTKPLSSTNYDSKFVAVAIPSTDTIPDFAFDPLPDSGEPMDLTPAEQAQVRELETSFTF